MPPASIAVSSVFEFSIFSNSTETPSVTGESRITNLSVRANLIAGRNLIAGFVVTGGNKDILIRASRPALAQHGLVGLPDPTITLYKGRNPITSNENWSAALEPQFESLGAFPFDIGSADAAMIESISGLHSVMVPAENENGIVLVEAYDAGGEETSKLVNISARYHVGTEDNVLITGFAITGTGEKSLLIRAIGPQLETSFEVEDVLNDPILEVYNSSGTLIARNDNWLRSLSNTFAEVGAFPLETNSSDSAIMVSLPANALYTVVASGKTEPPAKPW